MKSSPRRILYSLPLFIILLLPRPGRAQQDSATAAIADTAVSGFSISLSYSSKVLSAGRDYGVRQYGFNPSVIYTHKSGLYAGLHGMWLSETSPSWAATALEAGFGHDIGSSFTYNLAYAHTFFNPDSNGLLSNSLSAALSFSRKWATADLSYSLLFGEETGHELTAAAGAYFERPTSGWIDLVSSSPSITAIVGTANLPFTRLPRSQYVKGTGQTWEQYKALLAARRAARRNAASTADNELHLMGWDIALPLAFHCKSFLAELSYHYSIPVRLPDEDAATIVSQGYWGVSLVYTIK